MKRIAAKRIFSWRFFMTGIFFILFCWFVLHFSLAVYDYDWRWNRVWRYFGRFGADGFIAGPLCEGFCLTLELAFFSLLFSMSAGLFLAVLRLCPWKFCRWFSIAWIGIFRNTPLLLQLFFIYFLVSPLLACSPFASALISLTAFEGAYMAELFRGALLAVPAPQWEAGLSMGFSLGQCLRFFILPQTVRHGVPGFVNQSIAVLKDTSLVGAIAVADLSMQVQQSVSESFLAFEIWLAAAFIYLLLGLAISLLGFLLENRLRCIPLA